MDQLDTSGIGGPGISLAVHLRTQLNGVGANDWGAIH
jgi:hypothetical protein